MNPYKRNMNKSISRCIAAIFSLATVIGILSSCENEEIEGFSKSSTALTTQGDQSDKNKNDVTEEKLSALQARIGLDVSSFKTDSSKTRDIKNKPLQSAQSAFSALKRNVLADSEPVREWISEEDYDVKYQIKENQISTKVDMERGFYALRDGRGYKTKSAIEKPEKISGGYFEKSKRIIDGFLDDMDEISDVAETPLIMRSKDAKNGTIKSSILGMKVFMNRSVLGIPVAGERLVISYANDGSFRKLLGIWKRLDYSKTEIKADIDRETVVKNAAKKLYESGIDAKDFEFTEITPVFVTKSLGNGYHKLVLGARMEINTNANNDDPSTGTPLELIFELE